jgi:hypothetical protein
LSLTLAASVTTLTTSGWLQLANDVFYLIGSAVFQCMELTLNHESKREDILFFKVLAEVTRLTYNCQSEFKINC